MLTYILDPHAKTPLYAQLYTAIRQDITAGKLTAGERLPSKRQLSQHLKISQVTVETAYGQLIVEGYLISRPKRGYFVSQLSPVLRPVPTARVPAPAPAPAAYRYDFRTNLVDTDCFPFSTWARLLRETLTERGGDLLLATDPQGVPTLREEIRRYLYSHRGIDVDAGQILIGAGSEYLVSLFIQLLGRKRIYGLENPGYVKLYNVFAANDVKALPVPLDEAGLRFDALSRTNAEVVYLTPSHHFPLGIVMPVARRQELLHWAEAQEGRYLIEDDYDSEFRFASRPIPALKSLDHADRVIYINTFAKSLAPSLRIGYAVLPHALLTQFRESLGFYSSTVPSFEQYTLAKFMHSGSLERHISRSRLLYKSRRDALLDALQHSPLQPRIQISGAEAGLHLLISVQGDLSEQELIERAQAQDVRVYGLSGYYMAAQDTCPSATVLLGYAGIRTEDIREAVDRLCAAWKE